MKFFQRIKRAWRKLTGGGNSSNKATTRRSASTERTVTSRKDGGGGYYGGARYESDRAQEKAERKRQEERANAFKAKKAEIKSLVKSSPQNEDEKKKKVEQNRKRLIEERRKFNKATREQSMSKAVATGTEKQKLALNAQKELSDARKKRQARLKEWHEVTGNRFNVNEKGISAEERQRRRQNVKSQTSDEKTAVAEAKYQMKHHKVAESFARGALSGVTFGASDLVAKKGTKGEFKKAEEVYQKNKSKGAETVGEIAGSLASFGLTSGASKAVVKKALPKAVKGAVSKGGTKMTAKLASNKLIQKAAEKEVANAVAKGTMKEATKEAVERVAKSKAKELVANLAEDAAVNVTTGAIMDVNKAATTAKNKKEFAKEMGKSAAANIALGTGATVGLPAAGKAIKRALGGVTEGSNAAIKSLVKNASDSADDVAEKAVKTVAKDTKKSINANDLARRAERNISNADERVDIRNMARRDDIDESLERIVASGGKDTEVVTGQSRTTANTQRQVKKPADVMQGYQSTGHKKKVSATTKRAKELIEQGDIRGAKEEISRTVDDVVSKAKVVQELDDDIKNIQSDLRNIGVSISDRDKASTGYMFGGHNELRKRNFGNLKIRNGKTDIDDVWLDLQSRYGTSLFPEEIDNIEDQLNYLIDLSRAKGKGYDIAEDEADYLRRELADSLWESANEGREHAPFDVDEEQMLTEQAASRPFDEEELAELERTIPTDDIQPTDNIQPSGENEPYTMVNEGAEGINPDTPRDTARAIAQDMAEGNTSRTRTPDFETEAVNDALPRGTREARKAHENIHGEKIGKGDKAPTTDEIYDAYKDYHISQGTESRRKRSRAAASQINMMSTDAEKELRQRLVEQGELDYDTIFTPELYDKISTEFKEDAEHWIDRIVDASDDLKKISVDEAPEMQARAEYLMAVLDPSSDEAAEEAYSAAFKLAKGISSKSGQALNLRRNFVKLTRAGKIESAVDDLVDILDSSIGFNRKYKKEMPKGRYDRINFIKGKIMENAKIKQAVTALVDAKNEDAVSEAYTELLYQLNKQNPKSALDIIQEVRYLNMLGNPKTHIRNVLGSTFFVPMRQLSNTLRAGIEDSTILKNYLKNNGASGIENEITRHGKMSVQAMVEANRKNPTTEAGKAAKDAFETVKRDLLGSAKYDTPQYKGRAKTLSGKLLDRVADFNSNLLSKEDDFFKEKAFKENYIKMYNRYLKDGKPITEKVKRKIELEAIQEAQIATFNEYNGFAKWLNGITKYATDANATFGQRAAGIGVNAIMPFTKVPANLAKQSINYSPLGIAKGMAGIKNAARSGDAVALNKAIDSLASGVTGTGVFGLGMLLGKTTDMFTTNVGKNDPAAKFEKGQGVQNYSITFKDPITNETHSYTLDWLVPISATFFSGIEMANQLSKGDFNLLSVGGDWGAVMSRLAEPVMETSMLSGLHGMLETMRGGYGGDDELGAIHILLRETAQSYLNSLIPTLAGQVARTAYKSDMQVAGDSDWEYFRNSIKSKSGLANTNILGDSLGADTDLYGNVKNEKNSTGDYVASAVKNFLSPANIQKVDLSQLDKQKLAEYERRVKDGEDPEDLAYLFPKKQYKKTFKLGDEQIQMSNKELSTYNQAKTTGGEEGMRYILENIMFNRYELDSKGKKVPTADALTKEQKADLMSQFKGKSMREVEEWLYEQPEFKNATEAERKKAINGLWTLSGQGKANASQRVGEQAVIKAQGGDINEYNFKNELSDKKIDNLMPYVEAGVLTYEEAVDFARNAGKTYYYENEDGGSSQTYYNKKQMIEYLVQKGYSHEKAEALFNSFKASNAKPYSGNSLSSGRRGYGRRGYGRRSYRRRGGGGSSSTGAKVKTSDFKAKKQTYKSMVSGKSSNRSRLKTKTSTKVKPPTPKMKKYEV